MGSRTKLVTAVLYLILTVWSLFILIPLAVMVIASFKTRAEIFMNPLGLPGSLKTDSYARAWSTGMDLFILNSAIVTVVSVALIVIISGMAAYVLSRTESRLLQAIYLLIVAAYAVPFQAVLVPLYQIVSAAGFLNSQLAIVLPYTAYGIPFTTILFYAFFLDFPKELEEAARLDGCSQLGVFFRVIVPLSGPVVASAAIFQTVNVWNEFLLALMMLTDPNLKTLPVGILQLRGEWSSDWSAIMAGLSISIIPILAIFILAQRYFVRSLAGLGK